MSKTVALPPVPVDEAVLGRVLSAASAMAHSGDPEHVLDLLVTTVRALVPDAAVSVATDGGDTPERGASVFAVEAPGGHAMLLVGAPAASLSAAQSALIDLLCRHASLALGLAQANAAAEHTEALFETLAELSSSYSDASRVLQTIVRRTAALLGLDVAWLMLADEAKERLTLTTVVGITNPAFADMSIPVDDLMPGTAIRKRRVVCLRDVQGDEQSKYSRPEGLRTIMCAPMFVEDELVGVLVGAHREVRDASREDRRMMAALAGAAAVSITNARLYAESEEHAQALERAMGFQRSLTALVLGGSSLDEVVRTIGETLRCAVFVLSRDLSVLHRSAPDVDELDTSALADAIASCGTGISRVTVGDAELVIAPLELSGGHTTFVVVVAGEEGLDETDLGMTEAAVTAIGLELMRDRAAAEAEARLTGGLFQTLLSDDGDDEKIARRASYLGYELSGAHVVIAATRPAETASSPGGDIELQRSIERAVRRHARRPNAVFSHGDAVFVLLSDSEAVSPELVNQHSALIARELERFPDVRITFAGPHAGVAGVRRAVGEAVHALNVLGVLGRTQTPVGFGELGVWSLLGGMGDRERLRTFARDVLGELLTHDAARQAQLVETLRALVHCNFHLRPAAERLYVHTNTLRYRMARIAELTGLDPASPDDRLKAEIAVRILDVVEP